MDLHPAPTRSTAPLRALPLRILAASGLSVLLLASSLGAQEAKPLERGTRVRVRTAETYPMFWAAAGVVQEQTSDSVVLKVKGQEQSQSFAWRDLSRVEVYRGGAHSHVKAGAIVGGAVGLTIFGLLLTDTDLASELAPFPVVAGGAILVPTGLGALVGQIASDDGWRVYAPPRVSVGAGHGGRWLAIVRIRR